MTSVERAIEAARAALVDDLVRRAVVRTLAVERAFRAVRRHMFFEPPYRLATDLLATEFVETTDPCRLYADTIVAIDSARRFVSTAPASAAEQIEQLGPMEGMRLLHVGTGTGYYTAVLAELVGESGTVVGVEYIEELAEMSSANLAQAGYTTVTIQQGDGAFGVPDAAPFDRILVSAGTADITNAWIAQLADNGRLVVPLCHALPGASPLGAGAMLTVDKVDTTLTARLTPAASFALLQGMYMPSEDEGVALADGLMRWLALNDFLRASLPLRIIMKSDNKRSPDPNSVPWLLETRSAVMWVEPN